MCTALKARPRINSPPGPSKVAPPRAALAKLVVLCCCLSLLAGCASLGLAPYPYTKEASRRPDQEWWIKEDLALILARHLARASRADPDRVDPTVSRKLGEVTAICYWQGSFGGGDIDGGIRAMNFLKDAYFSAGGDYWTWRAAVRTLHRGAIRSAGATGGATEVTIPEGYR